MTEQVIDDFKKTFCGGCIKSSCSHGVDFRALNPPCENHAIINFIIEKLSQTRKDVLDEVRGAIGKLKGTEVAVSIPGKEQPVYTKMFFKAEFYGALGELEGKGGK